MAVYSKTTPGYYQTFTWYPFMWQGGGDIATPDGKRSAFASPATVQALKFWQDAIQQNVAPRNFLGSGGWDVIANLVSGFCAMQNLGIWGSAVVILVGLAISFALPTFAQQTNTSAATSTATPSTTTTPSTRGSTLPNALEIICRPLPVYELPAIDNRFGVGTIMRTISFWHQIALQLFILG